jgi:hypothetical protein
MSSLARLSMKGAFALLAAVSVSFGTAAAKASATVEDMNLKFLPHLCEMKGPHTRVQNIGFIVHGTNSKFAPVSEIVNVAGVAHLRLQAFFSFRTCEWDAAQNKPVLKTVNPGLSEDGTFSREIEFRLHFGQNDGYVVKSAGGDLEPIARSRRAQLMGRAIARAPIVATAIPGVYSSVVLIPLAESGRDVSFMGADERAVYDEGKTVVKPVEFRFAMSVAQPGAKGRVLNGNSGSVEMKIVLKKSQGEMP